jgi:hypothetical protein
LTIQDDLRDRIPPAVQGIQFATDRGGGIRALIVTFSEPLNPSTATDLRNYGYTVRTGGRDHRFGTADDLLIPISSAVYDPGTRSVRLALGRGIHRPTPFRFAINETTGDPTAGVGVADLAGTLLDGDANGTAGGPFIVVLSGRTGGFGSPSGNIPITPRRAKAAYPAKTTAGARRTSSPATMKGPLARPHRHR